MEVGRGLGTLEAPYGSGAGGWVGGWVVKDPYTINIEAQDLVGSMEFDFLLLKSSLTVHAVLEFSSDE